MAGRLLITPRTRVSANSLTAVGNGVAAVSSGSPRASSANRKWVQKYSAKRLGSVCSASSLKAKSILTAHSRPRRRLFAIGLNSLQQVDHFNRTHRCLDTFVTGFAASAFNRLLYRISRQHTKSNRHATVQRNLCNPFGYFRTDIFKMWRPAPDHRTQADNRVVLT